METIDRILWRCCSATADPVWKEYGKPDCGNLENESLLNDEARKKIVLTAHEHVFFRIVLLELVFNVLFEMFWRF